MNIEEAGPSRLNGISRQVLEINTAFGTTLGNIRSLQQELEAPAPLTVVAGCLEFASRTENPAAITKKEVYKAHAHMIPLLLEPVLAHPPVVALTNDSLTIRALSERKTFSTALPLFNASAPEASIDEAGKGIRWVVNQAVAENVTKQVKKHMDMVSPEKATGDLQKIQMGIDLLGSSAGGANEGFAILVMMFKTLVTRTTTQPNPADVKVLFAQNESSVNALMNLNFYPQKVLDSLVEFGVNPFSAGAGGQLQLSQSFFEFMIGVGKEVFTDPFYGGVNEEVEEEDTPGFLDSDNEAVFYGIDNVLRKSLPQVAASLPSPLELVGAYSDLQEKVAMALSLQQSKLTPEAGEVLENIKKILSQAKDAQSQAAPTEKYMHLIVTIMEHFDEFRKKDFQRETLMCPAKHAGVLPGWYGMITGLFTDWYEKSI